MGLILPASDQEKSVSLSDRKPQLYWSIVTAYATFKGTTGGGWGWRRKHEDAQTD